MPSDWYFARILTALIVPLRDATWLLRDRPFEGCDRDWDSIDQAREDMIDVQAGYASDTDTVWRNRHFVREHWNEVFVRLGLVDVDEWSSAYCDFHPPGELPSLAEFADFHRSFADMSFLIGEGNWRVYSECEQLRAELKKACPGMRPIAWRSDYF